MSDILAVDPSEEVLSTIADQHPAPSTLGNNRCVRTWAGDLQSLPAYQGPFDAAFLGPDFSAGGDDLRTPLLHTALLLRAGTSRLWWWDCLGASRRK